MAAGTGDNMAAALGLARPPGAPVVSLGTSGTGYVATRCVVLPYVDGERTPDLPDASGTIVGLRHSTTPGDILLAAYEGAAASLLGGFGTITATGGEVDRDAPLTLIVGGAAGWAWRDVVARLSGRALHLPEAEELVALGAAVQAAPALTGGTAADIARAWDTARGRAVDPVLRDDAALERIRAASASLGPALNAPR